MMPMPHATRPAVASDARKRAEEALARFDQHVFVGGPDHPDKLYHDRAAAVAGHLRALLAESAGLRDAIEIEREGQRSMARALAEINRLSRLDVAVNLAEPAPACGSVSTVRSDDPPAAPLPTCANCGSNLVHPQPAPLPSLADVVCSRNADLEQALARIESACGIPNPAEACRTILALCRDAKAALSAAPATGKEWPC